MKKLMMVLLAVLPILSWGQTASETCSRLFVPMTFYGDVAKRLLSVGSDDTCAMVSGVDDALMHVYLHRPDLVRSSERALRLDDAMKDDEPERVTAMPDIAREVSPSAIEPVASPTVVVVKRPNFWTFTGDYYLQFMQNYVSSNWYKGGESSYSALASVDMQYNYNNKQKVKWDNRLEMKLGYQTTRGDSVHKYKSTEDLIRYTTKLGLQASRRWYYTVQMIASTQFTHGYKTNDEMVYSDFMSPLTVNVSVGMDYSVEWLNKRLTGSIHLAPLAYNFKYVERLALATSYGLDEGRHTLHDLGSEVSADLTWKLLSNVTWKMRLYYYTTYDRAEAELENTLTLQINKFLSANIFVYPRFDDSRPRDDHHGYWELKEYASMGFSYTF